MRFTIAAATVATALLGLPAVVLVQGSPTVSARAGASSQSGSPPISGTAMMAFMGFGACGVQSQQTEYVVGVSPGVYGNGSKCGQCVTLANLNGTQTVTARVVDKCAGCNDWGLLVSKPAFYALGLTEDRGQWPITWSWTAC